MSVDKKGEVGVATIIIVFVAIIVGIALFVSISQQVGTSTSTIAIANASLGATVVNGTAQYVVDYSQIDDLIVFNETGDVQVPTTNYTQTNNVVHNGLESVEITPNALDDYKSNWLISGTGYPQGYVGGSARTIALLIGIFFALAVAVIALYPTFKSGIVK